MPLLSSTALSLATFLLLAGSPAVAQDEAALLQLWTSVWAHPSNHIAAVEACETFIAAHPQDSFLVVARSVSAWHHLRAGQTNQAAGALRQLQSSSRAPLTQAADRMARRWLTRIDHQAVCNALQIYYMEHIAYPAALDALASDPATHDVKRVDAFDEPWRYKTTEFKILRRIKNQRYELTSRRVGSSSDLPTSLASPYGYDFELRAVKKISNVADRPMIRFELTPEGDDSTPRSLDIVAGERSPVERAVHFVYAGKRVLILSNGDYWAVLGPSQR